MAEQRIGEVMKFFSKPSVAAVKITDGEISVGDTLKFTGHTTDLTMALDSMEVNNQKSASGGCRRLCRHQGGGPGPSRR